MAGSVNKDVGIVESHPSEESASPTSSGWLPTRFAFWYSAWTQLWLISMICFCCPGMYNSITGIGGSGQLDPTVADNATVALLAAVAVMSLTIVPPIFDRIGPRGCLLIGGWTYPLYSGALLCYNHTRNAGFVIGSGAILGIGAAFLWIAQGDIMIAYPSESQKGRAIGLFWVVFNLGGSVGGFMSFALNFHSTSGTVSNGTYIAFIIVMAFGWLLGALLVPPSKVIRSDGTRAQVKSSNSGGGYWSSIRYLYLVINWKIILLIPMFFCANLPYSYQQNVVNGHTFTIRSRSLNSALYWFAQIFGGFFAGVILDMPCFPRSVRSKIVWAVLTTLTFTIWGGGYAFQKWADRTNQGGWLDFTDAKNFTGPCFLYFFYGFYDACFQSVCYWVMGSLSNSPQTIARYVGIYKAVQSTGGAMAWRLNALNMSPMGQFALNWGLFAGSMFVALPTFLVIEDTTQAEKWEEDIVEGNTYSEDQPAEDIKSEKI